MNIFSLLSFFAFITYLYLGIYAFILNTKAKLNIYFFILSIFVAIWSFAFVFFYPAPDKETCWFWYKISPWGWCLVPPIILIFTLILTKKDSILNKWWVHPLLYLPGFIFYYRVLTSYLLCSDFIKKGDTWFIISNPNVLWPAIYSIYYFGYISIGIIFLLKWGKTTQSKREKKQAKIIIATGVVSLLLAPVVNILLPAIQIYTVPNIAHIIVLIWFLGIWYSIVRYKLMVLTPAIAAEEIISKMIDLLVFINPDGTINKVNNRVAELLGYDENELIGKSPRIILFDDMPIDILAGKSEKLFNYEINYKTKRGEPIPVSISCIEIIDNADTVGQVIVGHDIRYMRQLEREISERKQAQEELRKSHDGLEFKVRERTNELNNAYKSLKKSEENFRQITENMLDLIAMLDTRGIYHYVSPSHKQVLGYSPQDMVGRSAFDFIHPDDLNRVLELYKDGLDNLSSKSAEIRYIDVNNNYKWLDCSGSIIIDENGHITGVVISSHDISERKRMEMSLKESEEKYRTILENIEDGYFEIDLEGNLIFFNTSLSKITGYSMSELKGINNRQYMDKEIAAVVYHAFKDIYNTGNPAKAINWKLIKKNTDSIYVETSASLMRNNEGMPIGFCGIIRDITDRKKSEEIKLLNEVHLKLQQMALAELAKSELLYKGDINAAFKRITAVAGHHLSIERTSIWLFNQERSELHCNALYVLSTYKYTSKPKLKIVGCRNYFNELEKGHMIDIHDAQNDGRIEELKESFIDPIGIKSKMDTPLRFGGKIVGVLSFEQVGQTHEWTLEDQNFAGSISDIVAIAMEAFERKRTETALRISEKKLRERNEMIENDLLNAQIIQRALLPSSTPNIECLKIEYRHFPMESVGGDYFSLTPLQEGGLGVFIGDVAGHGVSAALFLSLLKATADHICRQYAQQPVKFMTNLNQNLINDMPNHFITAIYGFFRKVNAQQEMTFTFSKGGHPNPIMFKSATNQVDTLICKGTLVGSFINAKYNETTVALQKGDRIFIYTDGLPETRNSMMKIFGFDEFIHLIKIANKPNLSETLDFIIDEINRFRGKAPLEDDIFLIGFEVV